MKVNAFATGCLKERKITTYKFTLNGKTFMFDCEGDQLTPSEVSDVNYLFISHEHLDHWYSLYKLITHFDCKCIFFTTLTTKRIIVETVRRMLTFDKIPSHKAKEILRRFEKIQTLYFFNEHQIDESIKVTLYPSGHTFGSSMIYLNTPELKILYTGDMDFVENKNYRKYYCPTDLAIDLLIVDGTNFLGSDYKTQFINRKANQVKHIDHITFHVRPEKAVFLAQKLSEIKCLSDHVIIYENDLKWYLQIISEQGYNAYLVNRIVLERKSNITDQYSKTIRLSSRTYDKHNVDWSIGLHISKDDIVNFAHQFTTYPRVYLGHYLLALTDEYQASCQNYDFNLLIEGVNEL